MYLLLCIVVKKIVLCIIGVLCCPGVLFLCPFIYFLLCLSHFLTLFLSNMYILHKWLLIFNVSLFTQIKVSLWQIMVSGHSNFGTDQTNSVSYKSWHLQLKFETSLRSLRLILWPQEVSEVTEVKMKKIWDENPRIANFWLREM